MSPAQEPTVFIVDDDEDVRDALGMLMRASGLQAETFASARDFLARFRQRARCCLILDIRMPGMTGLELQDELHKRRLRIPIVFLTGHGDVALAVRAMKAGAADFIQKPLDQHRLVMAVMHALRADRRRGRPFERAGQDSGSAEKFASLSRREMDVLELLTDGRQNREIAEALCISVKTVEFHRANIRAKLGVASVPDLFRLVFAGGGRLARIFHAPAAAVARGMPTRVRVVRAIRGSFELNPMARVHRDGFIIGTPSPDISQE